MEEHIVKIISVARITHDVKRFRVTKPEGYSYTPGQATEVSVNSPELRDERRPFTFTGLNSDPFLEFTIKIYSDHNGVTNALGILDPGTELIVRDVWGAISYKGQGLFIAGGAGITPFLSIFRDLRTRNELAGNTLIFANKTRADIILEDELHSMLGDAFINVLSQEKTDKYLYGYVTRDIIKSYIPHPGTNVYLCGPPPMMDLVKKQLAELGVGESSIVLEL
ncbi:MAG TPA: FAD-binding oxidoreductase [Bacteroidales bacterium]|jgi:ferredoxin-NADP reductase|nr:FAD-binding oxidoreductase [Bacteroidales bacterium]